MRSIAPQTMQQTSPTPIMPVYARDSPVIPYQGRQAPIGTIPVQISPPNIELKSNTKQSPSKDNVEPEALPEKEKDGAITNGKTRGGDGGVGIGSGSNGNRNSGGGGGIGSGSNGNRNSGGGGGGGCGGSIASGDGVSGGNSVDGKEGKSDGGFNECPDLTPDILKNILNDGY
ncbi:hypothetical protein DINM_020489 [Dirofilaria immitis]|nr:hypothetical protein [Dirofilaria immitis]